MQTAGVTEQDASNRLRWSQMICFGDPQREQSKEEGVFWLFCPLLTVLGSLSWLYNIGVGFMSANISHLEMYVKVRDCVTERVVKSLTYEPVVGIISTVENSSSKNVNNHGSVLLAHWCKVWCHAESPQLCGAELQNKFCAEPEHLPFCENFAST